MGRIERMGRIKTQEPVSQSLSETKWVSVNAGARSTVQLLPHEEESQKPSRPLRPVLSLSKGPATADAVGGFDAFR